MDLCRLQNERKLQDNELKTTKAESFRFLLEKVCDE